MIVSPVDLRLFCSTRVYRVSLQLLMSLCFLTVSFISQVLPDLSSGSEDPSLEAKQKRDREQRQAVHRPLFCAWGLASRLGCFVLEAGDEPPRRLHDLCEEVVHGELAVRSIVPVVNFYANSCGFAVF